jgi:putative tryptophan/tyrosine transport system substrate-binding protein
MMDRRRFLLTSLAGALAAPLAAGAQQTGKVPRIGILSSSSLEREQGYLAALEQGLHDLGYSEGKNLLIDRRYAAGQFDTLPDLAADLVSRKVDILVVTGTPAALAAKKVTHLIPIVSVTAGDPMGTGLITGFARPGGNVTGLTDLAAGLVTKRLELLKEVMPSAPRVAVLLNPDNSISQPQLRLTQDVGPTVGVSILSVEARRLDDIERAFATMRAKRATALLLIADGFLGSNRKRIIHLAAEGRLPAIYWRREFVEDGGLMSYGASVGDLYRRAATYVDKILKGAKPGDLPVEQPSKFDLVINLKTAKALGLTIPPSLLARADRIIE